MLADPKSLHSDLGVQTWRAEDDYEGHILLQEDIVNLWKQGEDRTNWFEVVSYICGHPKLSNAYYERRYPPTAPFYAEISAEFLQN